MQIDTMLIIGTGPGLTKSQPKVQLLVFSTRLWSLGRWDREPFLCVDPKIVPTRVIMQAATGTY